jgi:hypothetical protein
MKKETAIRTLQTRVSVLETSLAALQTCLKKLDRQGVNASSRSAGFYLKLISQAHNEMEAIILEALSCSEEIETSPSTDQSSLCSEKKKLSSPTSLPSTPSNVNAKTTIRTTKNSNKKRNREEEIKPDISKNSSKIQKQEPTSATDSESMPDDGYPRIKIEPQDYDAPFLLSPSSASTSSSPLGIPEEENRSDKGKTFDPFLLLVKNEPLEDNGVISSGTMYQRKKQQSEELLQQFYEYNNNATLTSMPLSDTNLGFNYTYGEDQLESQQQVQQHEQSVLVPPMQQQVDIMEPTSLEYTGIYQRVLAADSFDLFAL